MKSSTDASLVSTAQAGNKAAFVDLVTRHQNMVTGIALAILGNFQASEDAAQEAFITAWQKLPNLRNEEKFRPWLAQIARNASLISLRKSRSLPSPDLPPEIPSPDEHLITREEHQIVLQELNALPEKLRLPLILFYREEQSVSRVSESLELTPDIVKKRLVKGRALLRDRIVKLLGPVMHHTRPGPIFTTTVASLIGAMMKPSAMAATAISASPKTAATTATVMTTSKLSLATTVLALGLCLPAGYQIHRSLENDRSSQSITQSIKTPTPSQRSSIKKTNDSALVAKWKTLKSHHLAEGISGYASLFQAIQNLQDPLQKEAFTLLCLTDWTRADPQTAFATIAKPNPKTGRFPFGSYQIVAEWLRLDPAAALAEIEQSNFWKDSRNPSALETLSKGDPAHLIKAFSLLGLNYAIPESIMVAAERNFTATESAIHNILTPPRRGIALSALARQLAGTDPAKAREWIASLPPEDQTDSLTQSFIHGLVKIDPDQALRELTKQKDTLSAGWKADVLVELSKTHFAKALSWAEQDPDFHKGRQPSRDPFAGSDQWFKLRNQFAIQLQEQGPAFLEQLQRENFFDRLTEKNTSAYPIDLRDSDTFSKTWKWLGEQDHTPGTKLLQRKLIASAIQENPNRGFQLLQEMKDHPFYQNYAEESAKVLMQNFGRNDSQILQETLEAAPPIVFEKIVTEISLDLTLYEDLEFWQNQLQHLAAEAKPKLVGPIASAMAQRDPSEAARWIESLPSGASRRAALTSSYQEWARRDPEQAGQSLNSLSQAEDFDPAANGYLDGLAQSDPEIAQAWLDDIGPSWPHYAEAAESLVLKMAKEEPDFAIQLMNGFEFKETQRENLAGRINPPAAE